MTGRFPPRAPFLAVLALAAGCATAPPGPVHNPIAPGTDAAARRLILDLLVETNEVRATHAAPALEPDAALTRAAQAYARELAARGELDHWSPIPGHASPLDRMRAVGAKVGKWGENLALSEHYRDGQVPYAMLGGWLDSPGHRVNLLNPDYVLTGIGMERGRDGQWYAVQLYAGPPSPEKMIPRVLPSTPRPGG